MLDDRQVPLIEHGSSRKSARNQLMVSRKINVKFSHFRIMTNNVAISVPNKLTTHNNISFTFLVKILIPIASNSLAFSNINFFSLARSFLAILFR